MLEKQLIKELSKEDRTKAICHSLESLLNNLFDNVNINLDEMNALYKLELHYALKEEYELASVIRDFISRKI